MYSIRKSILEKAYQRIVDKEKFLTKSMKLAIMFKDVPNGTKNVYVLGMYDKLEFDTHCFKIIFKSETTYSERIAFYEDIRMIRVFTNDY